MSEARLPIRRNPAFSFRAILAGVFALAITGLAGCSSNDDEIPYEERPVEQIYNKAMDHMAAGEYIPATKEFDEVERQHPYSEWARRSMLMGAYANYKVNQYDEAILSAQRFISLHPSNKDVPYAYYLVGLCYYEQISDVGRDQKMTENALNSFYELTRRFPNSEYARDARLKIDLTLDHLAGKEMEIGRYYLTRQRYLSAIARFRRVIDDYQTTTHVPEALHRITEAYLALGVTEEAKKTASVLGHNFPGSEWYIDSYALLTGIDVRPEDEKRGWLARSWNAVF